MNELLLMIWNFFPFFTFLFQLYEGQEDSMIRVSSHLYHLDHFMVIDDGQAHQIKFKSFHQDKLFFLAKDNSSWLGITALGKCLSFSQNFEEHEILFEFEKGISTCCSFKFNQGIVITGPFLRPHLVRKNGIITVLTKIILGSFPISCACSPLGQILFGCEDGAIKDINGSTLFLLDSSCVAIFFVQSVVIAFSKSGKIKRTDRDFNAILPGPVKGALIFLDGEAFLHWTSFGFVYVTQGNSSSRIYIPEGRVLKCLKINEVKAALIISNGCWFEYELKPSLNRLSVSNLSFLLKNIESREAQLTTKWLEVQERTQTALKLSRLSDTSLVIRLLEISKFGFRYAVECAELPKNSLLIFRFKQGNYEEIQTQTVSSNLLFQPKKNDKYLRRDISVWLIAFLSKQSYVRLLTTNILDVFETHEINEKGEDLTEKKRLSVLVFKIHRNDLKVQLEAAELLKKITSQDSITVLTPFRVLLSNHLAKILLEIDGDNIEMKANCINPLIASVVRESLTRRSKPFIKSELLSYEHNLENQRSIFELCNATPELEAAFTRQPHTHSVTVENFVLNSLKIWSNTRESR